jgi:hypothetical protein
MAEQTAKCLTSTQRKGQASLPSSSRAQPQRSSACEKRRQHMFVKASESSASIITTTTRPWIFSLHYNYITMA